MATSVVKFSITVLVQSLRQYQTGLNIFTSTLSCLDGNPRNKIKKPSRFIKVSASKYSCSKFKTKFIVLNLQKLENLTKPIGSQVMDYKQ